MRNGDKKEEERGERRESEESFKNECAPVSNIFPPPLLGPSFYVAIVGSS